MKKVVNLLLVLVMFVGITNVYAQQTDAVKEKRKEIIEIIGGKANNDAASFEVSFNDEIEAMVVTVRSKSSEIDNLGSQAPELFWHVMYSQWTLKIRTNMCMQLNVIYMELIMYKSDGTELGRYKDRLVK